jgi:pimeloyl-ACP methyl ester carboxylesterase
LVGTSYGGMVAFRMAEMYPNFVKKVVISSSGVGFMSTSLDVLLARSNLSSISELLLPSSVKGMKVFLANVTYKAMWLPNFILHDMLQVLYEENREERKQLLDHMIFGTKDALPLPQLSQEKFLIVWGEHDEIFNINLAYELQKHLGTSRAELVVMKNCGHVPQMENPKEYNRIILNFLKTCPQN